jgi:hypothetical protein
VDQAELLGHARTILDDKPRTRAGTLLVDGFWRGVWSRRAGQIHVEPFTPLSPAERDAVEPEAEMLRGFLGIRTG